MAIITECYENESYYEEQCNYQHNFTHDSTMKTNQIFDSSSVFHQIPLNSVNANISIAWRNLRYEVNDYFGHDCSNLIRNLFRPYRKQPILRRLNGAFEYHSLNGLMGPSGAGKTTLLNCLSGNVPSRGGLTSDSAIYVNGQEKMPIVSYFIEQHVHETIVGRLTVREILRYAFRFKNGTNYSAKIMNAHILGTIAELLLPEDVLDRFFDHCSGGEQKRIAIGQELMSLKKPTFLFVDEPTTGLDSFAAVEVVKCLKQLTENYRMTVIASIHVPNDEVLCRFDQLYVLAKGGVCIYAGPPKELRSHLELDVMHEALPQEEQPIEMLIKLGCDDLETSTCLSELADRTLSSTFNQVTSNLSNLRSLPNGLPNAPKSFSPTDLFLQISRQSRITFISEYRLFLAQLLFFIGITAVLGSFFNRKMVHPRGCYTLNEGNTTKCENDFLKNLLLTENINYICLNRAVQAYIIMFTSTLLFSTIVKVFRNEHRNKWYSLGVFYWSTNFVSIIQISIFSLALATVSYFTVGEHAIDDYTVNWYRFGHYLLCTWICLMYVQSLGQLIGVAILEPYEIALMISTVCFTFIMMLDDFFFKTDELHHGIFIHASNVLGMKYITRYLIYVFYGIGRCDPEWEYSWVLEKNYTDADSVPYYIARVVINSLIVRLVTLVLMYCKFNTFNPIRLKNYPLMQIVHLTSERPIAIDFNQNRSEAIDLNSNQKGVIERSKAHHELEFERFSRHKIIIGWRCLSLYGSGSIYQLGGHSIANQNNDNVILRELNGEFRFGTLNALMGMSGAGKTSLLRVLNGQCRTRIGERTQFYLSKFTKIETAFITQEVSGHLFPGLTTKQMLMYASRLKNPGISQIDHEKIALNLLEELCLADTANTKVDNCSGGERKRLALALELTSQTMPNLICIDEPTSGLDSNSAEVVVSCIRNLTEKHNLTIIASIHQPNSDLLAMFDQLYVLARGGVCVYSGPPNGVHHLLDMVSEIIDSNKYPIETLIKYSCLGHEDKVVKKLSKLTNSKVNERNLILHEDTQLVPDGVLPNQARFSFHSVHILTLRYLAYIRGYLWKEWLPFLILYLFYGYNLSIFFDAKIALPSGCMSIEEDFNNTCSKSKEKLNEEKQLMDNLRYNLFMSNLFLMIVMMQVALNLYKELELFVNEHRNGWYSSGAFYLMKTLFEIVPLIPLICIYVYICNIYEVVQPGIYWHLVLVMLLSIIATQGMAYIVLLLFNRNMLLSMIAGVGTYLTLILLSNLFISLKHLHYVYQFVSYLSIPRFSLEALVLLEYGFGRCAPREIQPVLYWMSLEDRDYYFCIGMLCFNVVLYRAVALLLLVIKSNPKENQRERVARISGFVGDITPMRTVNMGLSSSSHNLYIKQFQKY